MSEFVVPSHNWRPSIPDPRDFQPRSALVREMLGRLKSAPPGAEFPPRIDLRDYFAPVSDQRGLNSGTAHACVALVEYFERRALGKMECGSVQFVYKMSRKLLRCSGDSGSDVRTTIKAIVRFGIPPAK